MQWSEIRETYPRQWFEIQVGAMDYGFPIQGIIGMDFLLSIGAVIDLEGLEIGRT